MSTRLLVFLILQSWRFPASGGPVRWLVWSELNKGILPSSLLLYLLAGGSQSRINYQPCWLDISCIFFFPLLPLSHGTTGLRLWEAACVRPSSGLILLDGVTQLDAIVVWWESGSHAAPQYGSPRIINERNATKIWLFNRTDKLLFYCQRSVQMWNKILQ